MEAAVVETQAQPAPLDKENLTGVCGCKGIRVCLACEHFKKADREREDSKSNCNDAQLQMCSECDGCVQDILSHKCTDPVDVYLHGVSVIRDFVTKDEEKTITGCIDQHTWKASQSGRLKQDYGPKVNFKRKKVKPGQFVGLPPFAKLLIERLEDIDVTKSFVPVEQCNLDYDPRRGSAIDPHLDDAWLWGERLVTLNLLSDCSLNFTWQNDAGKLVEVPVLMPRRSLIVVQGEARHKWKHGIKRSDIQDRRIAITFRELSMEFQKGGVREAEGQLLVQTALTFDGESPVT